MSPGRERRPTPAKVEPADVSTANLDKAIVPPTADYRADLRGVRQPLRAVVTFDPDMVVVSGRHVGAVLRAAGRGPIYLATRSGWSLDRKHLADVVAILERNYYRVRIIEAGGLR